MKITDRMIEAAEASVLRECDDAIAGIRAELASDGEDECVDCGHPIEPARRAALPSAYRCIDCQQHHERAMERERRGL